MPVNEALRPDERALLRVLSDAVGQEVDVYCEAGNRLVFPQDETALEGVAPIKSLTTSAPVVPVELFVEAARADRAVVVVESDIAYVAMRLGSRSEYFAVASAEATAARWLPPLFENAAALHRASTTTAELTEENDSFAGQLASDLEELTFLRSMVASLSAGHTDDNLVDMASATLPVLNSTVRAKCLSFLRLPNPADPYTAAPAATEGDEPLDYDTLAQIVRRFGPSATKQPYVRNWDASDLPGEGALWDDEDHVPGVHSLVIAPLSSGVRMLGWLVAVNRARMDETAPQGAWHQTSWQLASEEFGSGEASLMATTASILATHAANLDLLREKEQLMVNMVRSLVSAIESKDAYTCGHSERVALYTRQIAVQMGYFDPEAENIYLASLLHDVGKIGVADAVLKKDGKLTEEEYAEISRHPDKGWAILCDLEQLRNILPGVLHHHERWDGRGYPDGLAGESIPIDGRVMAVADAYDAMTSDRPYRKGMPTEKAEAILREGAGTQWDPACIDAFFDCLDEIHRIKDEYQERERKSREPQRDVDAKLVHEVTGVS